MTTGYVVPRARAKGIRYTAYIRSAPGAKPESIGTFDYRDDAEKAITLVKLTGSVPPKPASVSTATNNAKKTLDDYFFGVFLPSVRNPRTRKGYRSTYVNHIQPLMGKKVLGDISRAMVKKMIDDLFTAGRTESAVVSAKKCLSATLGRALDDLDIPANPAYNIKLKVEKKSMNIVDPQEFLSVIDELSSTEKRLFAETMVESGCRFGEVTELRPKDIDWRTGDIKVTRAVSDVGADENPNKTGRFYVKATKGLRARSTSVSQSLLKKLKAHVESHGIEDDELIFSATIISPTYRTRPGGKIADVPLTKEVIEAAGFTEPNKEGRSYRHGTNTGYTNGECRCDLCRQAAREHSRAYRASNRSRRRKPAGIRTTDRGENTTGHLPNDVWNTAWREAVKKVLSKRVRTHDLRHSHATWLLKQGMDLHTLKERLGHSSIRVTETYLHNIRAMETDASAIIESLLGGA